MRSDIFEERKSVHIKLDKDVHYAIREKLFRHNITMQDRKSTRLNSSHVSESRMPSSA